MNVRQFFNKNADFREYVERYCNTYKITVEEALTHALVNEVADYYEDVSSGKIGL